MSKNDLVFSSSAMKHTDYTIKQECFVHKDIMFNLNTGFFSPSLNCLLSHTTTQ
jgi:hypothetical protein